MGEVIEKKTTKKKPRKARHCFRAWGEMVISQYGLGRKCNCWRAGLEGKNRFVISSVSSVKDHVFL